MKNINLLIFLSCLMVASFSSAQDSEKKNVLTLSIVKEPITLNSNRIKGGLAYQFDLYNQYFDSKGQRSNIVYQGMTSNLNKLKGFIEYGLTDNWQIGLYNNFTSGFEGYENYSKIYNSKGYNYNSVKEIRGFDDILLNFGFQLPFKSKTFSTALFSGLYFPVNSDPISPQYEMIPIDKDWTNINFTSFEKVGSGTFRAEISGKAKMKFNESIALLLSGKYNVPLGKNNSFYWQSIYDGTEYSFLRKDIMISPEHRISGNLELQVVPDKKEIMGLMVGCNLNAYTNKWSELDNIKTNISTAYLFNIYSGLELIVSEHIRFSQHFWYDVTGKNSKGAFGLETAFTINFIKK